MLRIGARSYSLRARRWQALTALGFRPLGRDRGQGLAEYALILALVAIVAILALTFLGTQISSILSYIGSVI
jgi:Flp pilus assembly pilin Flp